MINGSLVREEWNGNAHRECAHRLFAKRRMNPEALEVVVRNVNPGIALIPVRVDQDTIFVGLPLVFKLSSQ